MRVERSISEVIWSERADLEWVWWTAHPELVYLFNVLDLMMPVE